MKRPTGISGEIQLHDLHRKWLKWDGKGSEPPPAYKDCEECKLRTECGGEDARRSLCGACPWELATEWDEFPPGPSEYFCMIRQIARLPSEAISQMVRDGRLSFQEAQDVATYQESRRVF